MYGERPAPFAAAAGFGVDGDRLGWERLLREAQWVFGEYGDAPFVHWHHYERGRLDLYVRRYGDRDGVAARVRRNLLDLLPITEDAVALPLPSYNLKAGERYIRFEREQEEFGGQWAMAKYNRGGRDGRRGDPGRGDGPDTRLQPRGPGGHVGGVPVARSKGE